MAFGSFKMMGNENPLFDHASLDQEPTNGEELKIIQKIKMMVEECTFAWFQWVIDIENRVQDGVLPIDEEANGFLKMFMVMMVDIS